MLQIQRLPDTSLTRALAQGGRDHFERGATWHLLASIYDAVNVNTRATGQYRKGKAPTFDPYPRPDMKKAKREDARRKKGSLIQAIHSQFSR